jgi:K+-transporting ATPase KdpF subunit
MTLRKSVAHPAVAVTAGETEMNAESVLAIVLAVALIAYLMYSLLRPERF